MEKNPAPLRMPQMLGFPHYQSLFGHPKWLAGIFFLWAHFDEKMGVKLWGKRPTWFEGNYDQAHLGRGEKSNVVRRSTVCWNFVDDALGFLWFNKFFNKNKNITN